MQIQPFVQGSLVQKIVIGDRPEAYGRRPHGHVGAHRMNCFTKGDQSRCFNYDNYQVSNYGVE